MGSRRRFLRDAAILTVVGALPACLGQRGEPDSGDGAPDNSTTDNDSTDVDGAAADEQVRAYERAIHERVNEIRQEHGLDPLQYNEDIAAVAREHSVDMARQDYFAHESPEGEGPADRLEAFFPEHCQKIGENIANVGLRPNDEPEAVAERVVSGWMNSPPHRKNILREGFDEEGIGVAITDDGRVLVTQNFCATTG